MLWRMEEDMKKRLKQLAQQSEVLDSAPERNPTPPPPDLPGDEGHGYQYKGFGADLALEMCRNSLLRCGDPVNNKIARVVRQSRKAAVAKAFDVALAQDFLPEPGVSSGPR